MGDDELLTVTQAAGIAGVNSSTLRHAIKNGHLSASKVGSVWIVTRENLNRWMQSPAHKPKKGPRRKGQQNPH